MKYPRLRRGIFIVVFQNSREDVSWANTTCQSSKLSACTHFFTLATTFVLFSYLNRPTSAVHNPTQKNRVTHNTKLLYFKSSAYALLKLLSSILFFRRGWGHGGSAAGVCQPSGFSRRQSSGRESGLPFPRCLHTATDQSTGGQLWRSTHLRPMPAYKPPAKCPMLRQSAHSLLGP